MKVKCINNDLAQKFLTVGKEYEVIKRFSKGYAVMTDINSVLGFNKYRFVEVHEPQSHHNTTNLKGAALAKAESKAKSQEKAILELLIGGGKYTASEVWGLIYEPTATPLTSVRRALTNLMNKGKLIKTDEKKIGYYGSPEHYYKLK